MSEEQRHARNETPISESKDKMGSHIGKCSKNAGQDLQERNQNIRAIASEIRMKQTPEIPPLGLLFTNLLSPHPSPQLIHPFIYIYPPTCLWTRHLSIHPPTYASIYLLTYLPTHPHAHPPVCPCIHLPIHIPTHPLSLPSIYSHAHLGIPLHFPPLHPTS